MGACATKPKVLKADSGEAPAPAPETTPEDTVAGGGADLETKLENGGDGKATEIADDDKVDTNSRSLSNLFNDQIESNDSDEKEKKTTLDPSEKPETAVETDKQPNPPLLEPEPESEEKPCETNSPEPPPSDHVTDKTTIPSDAVKTQSEEKSTTMTESNQEIIDQKDGQTIEGHTVKVEANEPIETEKGVEVISN